MKDRTTRRRSLLSAPLGVSAASVYTTCRADQVKAARTTEETLSIFLRPRRFLSFDPVRYRLSGTPRRCSISAGNTAPLTHLFGRTRTRS